ncbi:MAG: co-chaperone Hsc20 [Polaromonas sp.]|nr:co-chaperone Hsc20 [Polaromonas sp.]
MNATAAAAARVSGFDRLTQATFPGPARKTTLRDIFNAAFTDCAGGFFIPMNLQSNDFELFGVPVQFLQDRAQLDARWKELQREAHPDKFAVQGAAAQRLAMQWSVRINEAYQRLKNPLNRASYLCELHGAPINAENNTAMPTAFLVQQMEWREALEEAKTVEDLDKIALQANTLQRSQLLKIERLLDADHDFKAAAEQVRSLMFIERFAREVDDRIDLLGQ